MTLKMEFRNKLTDFIQNGVAVFLLHRIRKKTRQPFQSQVAVHTLKRTSERSMRNFILGNLK